MKGNMTLVRIYLAEADHGRKHNLLEEIMELLHDRHRVHGVTVFRGIAGFGNKGVLHSADLLRLNARLPLVVEFFDMPTVVDAVLPDLAKLIPDTHILSFPVSCGLV
ncbi:MAG TPA: DUF190 domain-containing protein [Gammaproteobacteria bacterium]|nr:DUF190 domain-containing protein [Gammaproteobacteria bacterium]